MIKRIFLSFLIIICLCLQAQGKQAQDQSQFFSDLNNSFLQDYDIAKQYAVQQLPNIIVISGATANWYQKGKLVQSATIINEKYQLLKSLSHITLGISALRIKTEDTKDIEYKNIHKYHQILQDILIRLKKLPLTKNQYKNQEQLILLNLKLIEQLQKQKADTTLKYEQYYYSALPLIEANAADAAIEKLQIMQQIITPWLTQLNELQKKELYAVIATTITSRKHNLEGQFFADILSIAEDDERLLITENIFTPEKQLKILGGYLLETKIGQWLGDKERLHRDITADGAAAYLAK